MIDFHSHVLPGIDDGSSNIEETIQILTMLRRQGVDTVIATPHFYDSVLNVEMFLKKRESSYNSLTDRIKRDNICVPNILLGAEVYLSPDISTNIDLDKLCVGETKCILIEMPNGYWFDWIYKSLNDIIVKRGLTPVIAHLERYANVPNDIKRFDKLLEMDVFVQINAESFRYMRLRKIIKKLFENNNVHLIGSDVHNLTNRKPQIDMARKKIEKKYGKQQWDKLITNAKNLLCLK